MKSNCIICGTPVMIMGTAEIVACESDHCARIIEDNIGLHYVIGCDTAKPGGDVSAIVTYDNGEVIKIEQRA